MGAQSVDELAMVTVYGVFDMQVCVPEHWTFEQAREFAERRYPSGTTGGWSICEDGHPALAGDAARVKCLERKGFIHIKLVV